MMTDPRDVPEYDEITQMQLDAFNQQLCKATQAQVAISIVDLGKSIQSSIISMADLEDEAGSRVHALRVLIMIAGAGLNKATGGDYNLLIRAPDGTLIDGVDLSVDQAMWEKRN